MPDILSNKEREKEVSDTLLAMVNFEAEQKAFDEALTQKYSSEEIDALYEYAYSCLREGEDQKDFASMNYVTQRITERNNA